MHFKSSFWNSSKSVLLHTDIDLIHNKCKTISMNFSPFSLFLTQTIFIMFQKNKKNYFFLIPFLLSSDIFKIPSGYSYLISTIFWTSFFLEWSFHLEWIHSLSSSGKGEWSLSKVFSLINSHILKNYLFYHILSKCYHYCIVRCSFEHFIIKCIFLSRSHTRFYMQSYSSSFEPPPWPQN